MLSKMNEKTANTNAKEHRKKKANQKNQSVTLGNTLLKIVFLS